MDKHTPGPWYRSGFTVYALNEKKSCNRFSAQVQDAHTPREELEAVAKLMRAAPHLLADLREAASTLRRYEALHRAKGTAEGTEKAEVNATLASRFETTIAKATGI